MRTGNPNARAVKFFLDSAVVPISLMGDGLLPPDIDGTRRPIDGVPAPIVGTQDDGGPYGATFDALNIFELAVQWQANPVASLNLAATTWRLAYRNFGKYEALVTNQSVEARPGIAGVCWYEIRRTNGVYSLYQQGTYAPDDGVHRWMGSVAMDWQGNMALGYSVSNATDVFPGIRYTGRLSGDPLGEMTLGEGVIVNGEGVQGTTNSRWGDYTSMNVDPTEDCTFWYVNEYYTLAGQLSSTAGWQTRIGSLKLPGCTPRG